MCDPKGCCKTSEECFVPTSKECCDVMDGVFYSGDMSCKKCEKPTAIRLSSFNVTQKDGQNLIVWITGTEIETEGFHILRSTSPGGPYSRITPSMIASTGSPFSGGRYSFVDSAVEEGKSYYYKLEEVDARGNLVQYGPMAAVAGEGAGSSDQPAGVTPTLTLPHQGGGKKEDVSAGFSLRPQAAPTPVYTLVAYADGPAKFLSGEVVDEETVQAIRSQVLDPPHLTSPQRGEENDVEGEKRDDVAGSIPASPTSIRFRIIDAEGNEVAVASFTSIPPTLTLPHKGGRDEECRGGKGYSWRRERSCPSYEARGRPGHPHLVCQGACEGFPYPPRHKERQHLSEDYEDPDPVHRDRYRGRHGPDTPIHLYRQKCPKRQGL
ncbi:MAG TPA: hypothetical protein DDX84_07860 [Nitrospiraceae bacterium]|nr:hypothetical protein [Nitrospiraceae bacterium]